MSYEYYNDHEPEYHGGSRDRMENQDTVEYIREYSDGYTERHTVEYIDENAAEPEKRRLKLLEKAVICLVAGLLVWGLSSSKQPFFRRLGHYLAVALHTDFGTDLEQWGRNILQPIKDGTLGLAHAVEDWSPKAGNAAHAVAETWPIDGPVTAQHAWTENDGTSTPAQGITIAVTAGVAVQAVAPGIVTSVLPTKQGSYQVLINHLGDWQTLYQGINVVYVQEDDAVTAAQHIGHIAQNGGLGFAVKIGQSYVDPLTVLPERTTPAQ